MKSQCNGTSYRGFKSSDFAMFLIPDIRNSDNQWEKYFIRAVQSWVIVAINPSSRLRNVTLCFFHKDQIISAEARCSQYFMPPETQMSLNCP